MAKSLNICIYQADEPPAPNDVHRADVVIRVQHVQLSSGPASYAEILKNRLGSATQQTQAISSAIRYALGALDNTQNWHEFESHTNRPTHREPDPPNTQKVTWIRRPDAWP